MRTPFLSIASFVLAFSAFLPVQPAPALGITGISVSNNVVTLTITNLFPGMTTDVYRASNLIDNTWNPEGNFVPAADFDQWSAPAGPDIASFYYISADKPPCVLGQCCYNDSQKFLSPPSEINGNLFSGDEAGGPRGPNFHFDDIEFVGTAGETNIIEIVASSFDNYLYLLDETCSVVAEDNNSGAGNNALIIYTNLISGVYTVIITGNTDSDTGSFSVQLRLAP